MKQIKECIPIVVVSRIEQSKTFYTETLGFTVHFDTGEVVGLLHDKVMIYLVSELSEHRRQPAGSANLNFLVDEVDELFCRCVESGAEILVNPEDRTYGQRDFAIKDSDGNVLVFACGLGT